MASESNSHNGAVILQYHHIGGDTPASTSTSVAVFKQHLDYLEQENFIVWPLSMVIDHLRKAKAIPSKVVSITFDDAYKDIYEHAWPLLKEKNHPFTLFISTDLIGHTDFLSWDQIEEMGKSGLSAANHTRSHTHLLRVNENEDFATWSARVEHEITGAEAVIKNKLPHTSFNKYLAFPYGEYNTAVLDILSQLDYIGFGQQSGAINQDSDFRSLARFPLSGIYADPSAFEVKVHTRALPIQQYRLPNPELSKNDKRPTLVLAFNENDLLFEQLICYGPGQEMELRRVSKKVFLAQSTTDLPIGRSRYNCTMPVSGDKLSFYWFSQMWITKNRDGSWYKET